MKRSKLRRRAELQADPEKVKAWQRKHRSGLPRERLDRRESIAPKRKAAPKAKPRRLTPAQQQLKLVWDATVVGKRCACGCGRWASEDPHHVLREQMIKREVAPARRDEARWDPRNALPLAAECHSRHHDGDPLPVSIVPASVFDFARDYGLEGPLLERELKRYQPTTTGGTA